MQILYGGDAFVICISMKNYDGIFIYDGDKMLIFINWRNNDCFANS